MAGRVSFVLLIYKLDLSSPVVLFSEAQARFFFCETYIEYKQIRLNSHATHITIHTYISSKLRSYHIY
jgi:hypothetical protein